MKSSTSRWEYIFKRLWTIGFLGLVCVLTVFIFVSGNAFAMTEPLPHLASLKNDIISYVDSNQEWLCSHMNEIKEWSSKYHLLVREDGLLYGLLNDPLHSDEQVTNSEILDFFDNNSSVFSISFPESSELIVFCFGGFGNVSSSVDLGFYYSPDDSPAWIDSGMLLRYGNDSGKYLHYPMISDGEGWMPDKSVLNEEDMSFLSDYYLYTERICENFFYYKSGY